MISLATNNHFLFAISGAIILIGLYVLLKKPCHEIHRSFFIFAVGSATWILGFALLSSTKDFTYDLVINYGGLICVLGFFLLTQTFPKRTFLTVSSSLLYLPFLIAATSIIPWHLINSGMIIGSDGSLHPVSGPMIVPYSLMLCAYIVAGFFILGRSFRRARGHERIQIGYMFLGTGIFIAVSLICDALLPSIGITSLNLAGPLSGLLFMVIIAYAIVRHQLLDIRIIIQRGLIYTLLLTLIVAFYLGALQLMGAVINTSMNAGFLVALLTTIVGIFSVPVIEKKFRTLTDPFFFKDSYDYPEALRSLSETLYRFVILADLTQHTEANLMRIFKTKYAQIIVSDALLSTTIPDDRATLAIPIILDQLPIGTIALGEKRSGDLYTERDIHLLQTFAYQAATALSRAKLYEEVRHYAEHLEEKVRERTADIGLLQENQRQMMMDISHGLQTPLAVFQTKLEQLKAIVPDDGMIVTLEACLLDISRFIASLLRLARLEHRIGQEPHVPFDLTALIEESLEEATTIAEHEGIVLRSSLDPSLVVEGSPEKIREAVMNLIGNAVRYMRPEGQREIAVTLKTEGTDVLFSVEDTGLGITPDDIGRIFDRFYRGYNSMNTTAGTGLGLAITKHIVEAHGGRIAAESAVGKGTIMRMWLPLVSEKKEEKE